MHVVLYYVVLCGVCVMSLYGRCCYIMLLHTMVYLWLAISCCCICVVVWMVLRYTYAQHVVVYVIVGAVIVSCVYMMWCYMCVILFHT